MISRGDEVSVRRHCELLDVSRSELHHERVGIDSEDLHLMRRIDALYLAFLFFASRKLRDMLSRESLRVSRERVQRLMRALGLEALAPKLPDTSRPAPAHQIYPDLQRGIHVERVS